MKSFVSGVFFLVALTGAALTAMAPAWAQSSHSTISHGLSIFGDLKYAKDFQHFDYVNPAAPKGGRLSTMPLSGLSTFDSFNGYILKGDSAEGVTLSGGEPASLMFDSLMVRAGDEPDAVYGLVAFEAELAGDRSWVTFRLRSEARFHDGSSLTSADAVFSFNILKKEGHPIYRMNLRDVVSAEMLGPYEVRYTFEKQAVTRDLPLIVAELPIFSRAYYENRPFGDSSLEPPLASGPYKVARFKQGTFVEYEHDRDYWAKDLPVNIGRWNFDIIRFDYFRDRNIGFQAFSANEYDMREEFTSRIWATQYNFPAVLDNRVALRTIPDENPSGVQGWFLNTRRPTLSDPRVRQAIDLAFDYEWTNKTLFHGIYDRTRSYFQGSLVLEAKDAPGPGERAYLETYREILPAQLFERAYLPPVTDGSGRNRQNLRAAQTLLAAAGWTLRGGRLANEQGDLFEVEFLNFEPSFERIVGPFVQNLSLLGIEAKIRLVDPAQYQRRVEEFDFDITSRRYTQSNTPGVELRNYFGSVAADLAGTQNLSGVKDPVVDALIEAVMAAKNRQELNDAARALDRVLREGHYWVSHWSKAAHHLAFWDKFAWPDVKPKFQRGVFDTWWLKEAKAAADSQAVDEDS